MWKQWNIGNPSSWRLRKVWTKEDFSVSKLAPFWPQSNRRNDTWHSCRLPCGAVILVKALDFAGFSHQNSWINQAEFKSFTNLTALLFTNQPLICSPKKTTNQFILGFSDKFSNFKHMLKKRCYEPETNLHESSTFLISILVPCSPGSLLSLTAGPRSPRESDQTPTMGENSKFQWIFHGPDTNSQLTSIDPHQVSINCENCWTFMDPNILNISWKSRILTKNPDILNFHGSQSLVGWIKRKKNVHRRRIPVALAKLLAVRGSKWGITSIWRNFPPNKAFFLHRNWENDGKCWRLYNQRNWGFDHILPVSAYVFMIVSCFSWLDLANRQSFHGIQPRWGFHWFKQGVCMKFLGI